MDTNLFNRYYLIRTREFQEGSALTRNSIGGFTTWWNWNDGDPSDIFAYLII